MGLILNTNVSRLTSQAGAKIITVDISFIWASIHFSKSNRQAIFNPLCLLHSFHLTLREGNNLPKTISPSPILEGFRSRDGAVVEHLPPMQASHQCGPGSIPGLGVKCGLSLLLVLVLAPRGFSPGTPVFLSPKKPTFPNSNSIWNSRATGLSVVLLVSRTVKCHPR